jgi:threonine aldolase
MFKAVVGDDVYKQDPTVIELEAKVAAMFGMERDFPFWNNGQSNCDKITYNQGTIMDKYAHVYHYEGGGASFNSGVSCCLLDGTPE